MSAFVSLLPRLSQLAGRVFIESVALIGQLAGDAATRYGSALDRAIPENWTRLTYPEMKRVASLMAQTAWSLAWTPRIKPSRTCLNSRTRPRERGLS